MYRVMVCEDTETESASGDVYELDSEGFSSLELAHRNARAGRWAYPCGNAWVEDEYGKVIPDPMEEERKSERDAKIALLRFLERRGIVRETFPEPDSSGGSIWIFQVLKPDELLESFQTEYDELGELRW